MSNANKTLSKKILLAFFFCNVLSLVFILTYQQDNTIVKKYYVEEVNLNVDEYYYGLDPVKIEKNQLIISGWVVKKNSDLNYISRSILLIDENNNYYKMNTVKQDRNLTEFYNNGFNYDYGGLIAQCSILQFKEGSKFKIAILVNEQNGESYLIRFENEVVI